MIDLTTRILLEKYRPNSPLLQEVPEPEPVEVEKASITMEELFLKVRSDLLTGWGLDPEERHVFADQTVAWTTVLKCREYNVTDMPPEGLAWL